MRQLKPTCVEDIIAANAMYRPGPMDSIPDYVAAKHSGNITYDCHQLEPILKNTYGQIVYQETVMQIFRDLAGYSLGRSDLVRRAMSKKHMEELEAERQNFIYGNDELKIHGCVKIGINADTANKIFEKMLSFAAYAFNKSHSAAYSVTSYMTAWLKYHYPTEFFCATLNFVDAQKELPSIIADAKKHNINILPPDINKSMVDFSIEGNNIRFGLKFLTGAKNRANAVVDERGSGFKSFKDFVKMKPGKAVAEACILSGACDMWINNHHDRRQNLLEAYEDLKKIAESIAKKEERLSTDEDQKLRDAYVEECRKWENYEIPMLPEMDMLDRLSLEQKYTSVYFSGDPMLKYEIPAYCMPIDALENSTSPCWVAAAIVEKKELKTKKDAKKMLSGLISDQSGAIKFVIFPKVFDKIESSLQTVMAFHGKWSAQDGEEPQFIIDDVKTLPVRNNKRIVVFFDDYRKTRNLIAEESKNESEETRYQVIMQNAPGMKMYTTHYLISEEFAKANQMRYVFI